MAQIDNEPGPSTSTDKITTSSSKIPDSLVRLPKVVLTRLDEQTLLNLSKKRPKKPVKRLNKPNDKVKKVLTPPRKKAIEVKRPRGRPKSSDQAKTKNLKQGLTNKTVPTKKTPSSEEKLKNKSVKLLKKNILQKRSKVVIPSVKKVSIIPKKVVIPSAKKVNLAPRKIVNLKPKEIKPAPPKPKLEVIRSRVGESSSDSSEDEFLYDELIEELENTANKWIFKTTPVPETTTITLKPNAGNKPPTVLKGGIVKRTDLPSDLNLIASSNKTNSPKMPNGLQEARQTQSTTTPGGKKRSSGLIGKPGPVKKPSPWPISIVPSPKKSMAINSNSQKNKSIVTKIGSNPVTATIHSPKLPTKNIQSSSVISDSPPEFGHHSKSVTLGMTKPKIGPKQTAKVVPLSKSFDQDENLSDEYLEEETLDCDLDLDLLPKKSPTKSNENKSLESNPSPALTSNDSDTNLDLIRILTDETEEPVVVSPVKIKEKPVEPKSDVIIDSKKEIVDTGEAKDKFVNKETQNVKGIEQEPPVRTIYDLINDVSLQYPSWNLHIIPETSAFCIAQVTKGRLGLPTLKRCIELDPVTYNAKVYIHQYHIKRFDGVYDSEESILALIQEIDSIKA